MGQKFGRNRHADTHTDRTVYIVFPQLKKWQIQEIKNISEYQRKYNKVKLKTNSDEE